MEHRLFVDVIYILALSALTLLTCTRIRVPTIVGFLLVGILAGPSGFGLVQSGKEVETLAELGGG
jgi:CPA2 family monovalent cation:H+ antiporter-2